MQSYAAALFWVPKPELDRQKMVLGELLVGQATGRPAVTWGASYAPFLLRKTHPAKDKGTTHIKDRVVRSRGKPQKFL